MEFFCCFPFPSLTCVTKQYEDLVWGLFMAKYIFPGADASMPLSWVTGQLELAGFEVAQVSFLASYQHYAEMQLRK